MENQSQVEQTQSTIENPVDGDAEPEHKVVFLNPFTCGIYKDGGPRFKVDRATGQRTEQIDNELGEQVGLFLGGATVPGAVQVPLKDVTAKGVMVPRYYDPRWLDDFRALLALDELEAVSMGEMEEQGIVRVRGGHGSPSSDRRSGHIPYVKVSDIRSLRVNVNPTNLVSDAVAQSYWRGPTSGLEAWDLVTPNRASSNIGEFAIVLPGEEQIVLTKEVFLLRITGGQEDGWDAFYLLWALCLQSVRTQWSRVTLMQTNREDVGRRYKEILLPKPKNADWARTVSEPFRKYFTTLASARTDFLSSLLTSGYEYIASARSVGSAIVEEDEEVSDEDAVLSDEEELLE